MRATLALLAITTLLTFAAPALAQDPLPDDPFVCIPENPEPCECLNDVPRGCIREPEPCKVGQYYIC